MSGLRTIKGIIEDTGPERKTVPLVYYDDGERNVIGTADVVGTEFIAYLDDEVGPDTHILLSGMVGTYVEDEGI